MFPDLFSAIGTTYGAGDGSTTFNLPDYNAAKRFAQGDTVAGTVKQAGLPNIEGGFASQLSQDDTGNVATSTTGAFRGTKKLTGQFYYGGVDNLSYYNVTFDASRSNSIYGASNTVQPPALTARYIIKYE
jgi:microcystin-dependent protein